MNYNPFMSILLNMLGQAMADQARGKGRAQNPQPDNPYVTYSVDDEEPIDVEAEVVDSSGKTATQRARDAWDKERKSSAGHALSGATSFAGSKNYNILVVIACVLLVLDGAAYRVYSLVMGNIFSATIVPVALGAIVGIVIGLAGAATMIRFGQEKVPFFGVDLVLVFFSAVLMGWGLIFPAFIAALICLAAMKLSKTSKKIPFIVPYAIVAVAQWAFFGFPGLYA